MKQYNIYKTVNLVNGKFYWGVHDSIDENDGYFGSGVVLQKAIKKHGKENFRRKTMVIYETADAAYFDEGLIVNQAMVCDSLCYNLRPGGKGAHVAGKNNPMFGKTHSRETRTKLSAAKIGKVSNFKGKRHSDEAKRKMKERKAQRRLCHGI